MRRTRRPCQRGGARRSPAWRSPLGWALGLCALLGLAWAGAASADADLAIAKTDGKAAVSAGGGSSYTLTVTNNGPGEVTAAPVADTAPANLSFGAWTCAVASAGSGGAVTTACGAASGSGNLNTTVTMKNGAAITYTVAATAAGAASGSLANTATVTAPAGVTDPVLSNNSATDTDTVVQTGSIGNYVWLDEDGNGVQSAGEAGLPNLRVELKNSAGTAVIATTHTDANGGYLFGNVAAGSYLLVVTPAAGLNATYNEDTGTTSPDNQSAVTLAAGVQRLTADFGYNWVPKVDSTSPSAGTTGTLGDKVWNDANGNGLQDPGEPGIGGVTLNLRTDANQDGVYETVAATATTDAAGLYLFDGLATNAYVVEVAGGVPAGMAQTADPDATLDGKTTGAVVLAPGDVYVNVDFGYRPAAGSRIGDTLYLDANANGAQDAGEPGIAGVSVALRNGAGTTIATTLTDAGGQYGFAGLPAGTYTVAVTDSDSVLGQFSQSADPDALKDGQSTATVDGTADNLAQDFGYTALGQQSGLGLVGDTVYLDRNASGGFNAGEGLQGVTVSLYASNGATLLATAVTNENGVYAFGGLDPAGTYVVKVTTSTLPAGGTGLANSIDPDGGGNSQSTVNLGSSGGISLAQDFGYTASSPGSVGGTLWQDSNADGTLTAATETGRLAGVTVVLTNNSTSPNILGTTTTDASGNYTFSGLPLATYRVHVTDAANRLDGWWQLVNTQLNGQSTANDTGKADPFTTTLTTTTPNITKVHFGYYNQGAALGNRVWNDANGNGVQDGGETGLANAKVTLLASYALGGTTTVAVLTDGSGGYSVGNLLLDESFNGLSNSPAPPSYVISAATPSGYNLSPTGQGTPLTDSNAQGGGAATAGKGQTSTALLANPASEAANAGYDFGFYRNIGTVSGHLYIDTNNNGAQDAGEPNLANVDIIITDGNGSQTVASNAGGNYSATVKTGTVTVDVDNSDPQFPAGYTQTQGTDPTAVTVLLNQNTTVGTEGYAPPASLFGTVAGHLYIDTNGSGHQDAGEPNLANIDVLVTDKNGGTQTVSSNAGGNYSASVVAGPASADVQESDPQFPAGYTRSEGADPATVIAVAGASTPVGSDGYAPPANLFGTVTGHLYIDTNGSGHQDAGEPNLPNIDVLVTDKNGGTQTVSSDAGGHYSASVVAGPASADVQESDPQFPAGYTRSEGADPATVTAVAGASTPVGSVGYAPPANTLGGVAGHLYIDSNGNGRQDTGEPDLANVDVIITDKNGGTQRAGSDASGNYSASGIPAGSTVADVDNGDPQYPAGYAQTEGSDPTTVTVVGGQTANAGNDGYHPPVGSVGNAVWLDENGDGVQDAGEAGLPNVKVELRDASGATVLATTYTDADGGYLFDNVPAGAAYQLKVYPTAGLNPTDDEDGISTANTSQTPAVAAGVEHLSADFGYNWVPPADSTQPNASTTGALGDRVWNDADGDGVQDPGESGIGGVALNLRTDADQDGVYETVAATATTDAAGLYVFDGLAANAYVVEVAGGVPAGMAQTGDPDATLDGKTTSAIVLAPGDVYVNADFGYRPAQGSTVGDRIYLDANGDGQDTAGEPGVAGVSVALVKDLNGNRQRDAGEPAIATDVTDAGGHYAFPGLPTGPYLVVVTDTDHVLGGWVQDGDPDGGYDGLSAVTVDGSSDNLLQNAGYAPLHHLPGDGFIGDTVFLDRDGNGAFDAGEGLEGVKADLYDGTGLYLGSAYTNENGQYAFGGLVPDGLYTVAVDTGTLPGPGLSNSVDPDGGTASQSGVALTAGSPANLAQDFGYRVAAGGNRVGGTLWNDKNADGTLNEAGRVSAVTVELLNAAGHRVGTARTDADGGYSFAGLPDGGYRVQVTDAGQTLAGWWKSNGANNAADSNSQPAPYPVAVAGGQSNSTADFGYYDQGAALGNRVWRDENGNGVQDGGEAGLAGEPVTLVVTYPLGGTTTVVALSGSGGDYRVGNLLLDESFNGQNAHSPTYVISAATPARYSPSPTGQGTPLTDSNPQGGGPATVLKGQADTSAQPDPASESANAGYDFGFVPPPTQASGHLYIDTDGNGRQDAGEPNLANVDVVVTGSDHVPHRAATDAGGNYTASGLPANTGTASVDVDSGDPQYPAGYTQTEGADPNTVAIVADVDNAAGTDGYAPAGLAGALRGHLYIDTSGNGQQEAGEPNLANVDVLVTDANGGTRTVSSDQNGDYAAAGIPPGVGTVDVQESDPQYPAGYARTQGQDPNAVTVFKNATAFAGTDGYAPPANTLGGVAGHLFIDSDGSGAQNGGEPNLPSVDVVVTDRLGGTHRAASDAGGNYTAAGVPAGAASVDVDNADPDFPAGDTQTAGSDPSPATVVAGGTADAGVDGYRPPVVPPQLQIQQGASTAQPAVGQPFVYTLAVSNTGGTAGSPALSDAIPAGLKITAVSPGGWTCTTSSPLPLQGGTGASLSCGKTNMAAGSETIRLTAVATAVSGSVTNYATITGDGDTPPASPGPSNCTGQPGQNCGSVAVAPTNPRIALAEQVSLQSADETVTADGLAQAGEQLSYSFTLSNRGDASLAAVALDDPQLNANSLSCAAATAQGHAFSLGGSLAANDSVVCAGQHTVSAGEAAAGRVVNAATAAGTAPDGSPVQSAATGEWDNAPLAGQISLAKAAAHNDANGNGAFDQGETVAYSFVVNNVGGSAIHNLAVADTLLQGQGLTVACPSTSLAAGAQAVCTASGGYVLTHTDEAAGKLLNTATATGLDAGGGALADTDTRLLYGGQAAGLALKRGAWLSADADHSGTLTAGDTLAYTLVATNTGGVALTNVTVSDNTLGTALQATGACLPQQGSTLNPGQQMVCKAAYTLRTGEASPLDGQASATGTPVGRSKPVDAAADQAVPLAQYAPPPAPLYAVGNRVWLDANNDGVLQATEAGIDGVTVRLQRSADGSAWATATYADGSTTIPDQVTAGGGYYQFANVPQNPGQYYRAQVLPYNFTADVGGARALYGAVSSSADAASFAADGLDQGVGGSPSPSQGIASRGFDLGAAGGSPFNPVDFGFLKKSTAAPPDLQMIAALAQPAQTVNRGGTLAYNLLASNAVGAGSLGTAVYAAETLPAGLTVAAGWPSTQPAGWSCTVNAARSQVTCKYVGGLPLAGGADLGGVIAIPVNVSPTMATGPATATASVTKLVGEPGYTNNIATVTITVQ